ncbi:MAG: MarR family winged helix-turn-helix transcriptional regulator [Firmicutes bacterium]|nr:MarR family winged helix-turn-helix transcriptional regulator [Bacillota bacterium]
MDYRRLAIELIGNMQLPGKERQHKGLGGARSELMLLMFIEHKEEVVPKDISEAMGVSTARIAIALNDFADKGLITREIDDNDRRRIIVKLTPKGKEFVTDRKQIFIDKITEFLALLGEHDAKEYVRIMGRISEIMRKHHI